ncbi:hypothetical protein [Gordonia malaquae]|uniref:hypothetical protein n=1 Tax=Gordonia malaquae TaxID=410332 RepID=UPI003019AF42
MSTYNTIDDIKAANTKIGHSWFDPTTTAYHGSRIESEVIGGRYFVESSFGVPGDEDSGRIYRAVEATPTGDVGYLAGGERFASTDAARAYIETVIAIAS